MRDEETHCSPILKSENEENESARLFRPRHAKEIELTNDSKSVVHDHRLGVNVDHLGGENSVLELSPSSEREERDVLVGLRERKTKSTSDEAMGEESSEVLLTSIPSCLNLAKIELGPRQIDLF